MKTPAPGWPEPTLRGRGCSRGLHPPSSRLCPPQLPLLAFLFLSFPHTFLLSLGRLGAGSGLGPTAAGFLGLGNVPLQSDGGLSRSLVLGPVVSCGGCLCSQAPQNSTPLLVRTPRSCGDEAGSICPVCTPVLPVQGHHSSTRPLGSSSLCGAAQGRRGPGRSSGPSTSPGNP